MTVKEFEHSNMNIIRAWPYALKIDTTKTTIIVYFDVETKFLKWKDTLYSILDLN